MTTWRDGTSTGRAGSAVETRARMPGVVYAYDYGVRADNSTDNLLTLQAAIDAAAAGVSGAEGNAVYCDAGVMLTSNQIKNKNKVRLVGTGRRASQLVATPGFPINTGVLRLDDASGFCFDCRVENMVISASNIAGSQCVISNYAQEGSGVFNCLLANYRDWGILFDGLGSGGVSQVRVEDLEVYGSGLGSSGGIRFYRVAGTNSIRQITVVNQSGVTIAGSGVSIETSFVNLYDIHSEYYVDGIKTEINSAGSIIGAHGHPNTTNAVHFGSNSTDWTVQTAYLNGGTTTVLDDFNGVTLVGNVPFYSQAPINLAGARVRSGNGSPNSAVTGNVGDLYLRRNGGANTTLYIKESGAGTNTGWVAK